MTEPDTDETTGVDLDELLAALALAARDMLTAIRDHRATAAVRPRFVGRTHLPPVPTETP
ncbi:hypothetical protein [Streptomyces sp. NPDC090025]|uniref:hypothetical protein n=1 Tax=Streptomyces sp. NPDC090025 TaxID=3365922 RepID=UPI0038362A9E